MKKSVFFGLIILTFCFIFSACSDGLGLNNEDSKTSPVENILPEGDAFPVVDAPQPPQLGPPPSAANLPGAKIVDLWFSNCISLSPTTITIMNYDNPVFGARFDGPNPGGQEIEYALSLFSSPDNAVTPWVLGTGLDIEYTGLIPATLYCILARSAAMPGYDAGTPVACQDTPQTLP